jgi:hypothetical protein
VAWLVSPQQGFSVDSSNGPTPLFCNVIKGPGGRSFIVDYGIETCLRECNLETSTYPSIFLSHRWEMRHEIDDDFFTSRVIEGHVIFDTARLAQGMVNPDDYRGSLFHPVPNDFQRTSISVRVNEDNTAADYMLVDEELEMNIGKDAKAFGVTKIEASHSASLSTPGPTRVGVGIIDAAIKIVSGVVTGIAAGGALAQRAVPKGKGVRAQFARRQLPQQIRAGQIRGGIVGGLQGTWSGAERLAGLLPMMKHTVVARVWGRPDSFKQLLESVAIGICGSRMEAMFNLQGIFVMGLESTMEWDLAGRYVEASLSGIGVAVSAAELRDPGKGRQNWPLMPQKQPVDGGIGSILTTDSVANPGLLFADGGATVNGNGSRSKYLEHIVVQGLVEPCQIQPSPRASVPAGETTKDLNQFTPLPFVPM